MEFQLNLCISLGAIGRPGLQGFPGHNLQGPKGIFFFFTFFNYLSLYEMYSTCCNFVQSKGLGGSPGRHGVDGFIGDRGEVFLNLNILNSLHLFTI